MTTLTVRRVEPETPRYSISGDLLSFLDCGLRYRYQHRGQLPPSRPVQFWAGLFVHGVVEEAFRYWRERDSRLPWPTETIEQLGRLVAARLVARGISFRGFDMLGLGMERAIVAVETWGPDLFALIDEAEIRLRGVRPMPPGARSLRGDRYEIDGVADVVARRKGGGANAVLGLAGVGVTGAQPVDLIVDYKGTRRPGLGNPAWFRHEWQVATYAWLRGQQVSASGQRAALLFYLNELVPGPDDMRRLRSEVNAGGGSDILPYEHDLAVVRDWLRIEREWQLRMAGWEERVKAWYVAGPNEIIAFPRMPYPEPMLSQSFRQARSVRTIRIDDAAIARALDRFDEVVARIERSVTAEVSGKPLVAVWPTVAERGQCARCDFRAHCPDPENPFRGAPTAP